MGPATEGSGANDPSPGNAVAAQAGAETTLLPWRWHAATRCDIAGCDWAEHLARDRFLDPYLVWAYLSSFDGMGGVDALLERSNGALPVLVEVHPPPPLGRHYTKKPDSQDVDCLFALLDIPGIYKELEIEARKEKLRSQRFFSARVLPCNLPAVLASPLLVRLQLGVARIADTLPDPLPVTGPAGGEGNNVWRTVVGIIDDGYAFAHPAFCNAAGRTRVQFLWDQDEPPRCAPWQPVIKAFGYGAELRHPTLDKASIESHQLKDELHAYCSVDYVPLRLELGQYSTRLQQSSDKPAKLPAGLMRHSAHGTGALFLAAGVAPDAASGHPLDQQQAVADEAAVFRDGPTAVPGHGPAVRDDAAAEWPIVAVQLPSRTTLDTSGGSLGVHVLDGLYYILDRARCIAYDPRAGVRSDGTEGYADPDLSVRYNENRVVVNVSYGALAGPHDGTSLLEEAIIDLCSLYPLWVCTAAGNAHGSRSHARAEATADRAAVFEWVVGPDNPHESFLEVWLPDLDNAGGDPGLDIACSVAVQVRPPGREPQTVRPGQAWLGRDPRAAVDLPAAGAVFARRVVQGRRGTMLLLACARTRAPMPGESTIGAVAPHGSWWVEVNDSRTAMGVNQRLDIHAWTERNDLLYGTLRAQQSTVYARSVTPEPTDYTPEGKVYRRHPERRALPDVPDPLQPGFGLGSIAGAGRPGGAVMPRPDSGKKGWVLVAGGYRLADGEMAPYSSGGPYRQYSPATGATGVTPAVEAAVYKPAGTEALQRPHVDAPSDVGTALRGLRVPGLRAGSNARLGGTSAAAPQATRHLANKLHADRRSRDTPKAPEGFRPPPVDHPDHASRPTPHPEVDDRFRSGLERLR